eukprot:TRINITY_DN3706_c2_g1_i1.p1 TRINITY_DN3706_c2_g1~~TRINITY_DN3706_c2_g1_i1.p1  ORF type:complete len:100 (+),score=14.58 TRINITY_DN3706_c2_g1_i1:416-715(+)
MFPLPHNLKKEGLKKKKKKFPRPVVLVTKQGEPNREKKKCEMQRKGVKWEVFLIFFICCCRTGSFIFPSLSPLFFLLFFLLSLSFYEMTPPGGKKKIGK